MIKEDDMIAYKVFDKNFCCRGFQYKVGKTYEIDKSPILCEEGFHACKNLIDCFSYYPFNSKNKVAIVELLGEIKGDEQDKQVTNKIRIVKEISWQEVLSIVNTGKNCTGNRNSGNYNSGDKNSGHCNSGDRNSGDKNSGDKNSGDWNSGDWNSGDWNSGNWNSGNRNSGNWNSGNRNSGDKNSGNRNSGEKNSGNRNSGHWNSGHCNSGDKNSGHCNSGDWNSGDRNSGDRNSGDWNSGDRNSGDRNSGDRNSGNWNSGNCNSGDWNTKEPEKVYFMNTLIDKKELDAIKCSGAYCILNRFYPVKFRVRTSSGKFGDFKYLPFKSSFKHFWRNLSIDERKTIINMPYFNKKVFFEITGVKIS